MRGRLPDNWVKDKSVEERIRLYRFLLYAQIAWTALLVIGIVLFILILAGIIGT